jgi:hypothetical protein
MDSARRRPEERPRAGEPPQPRTRTRSRIPVNVPRQQTSPRISRQGVLRPRGTAFPRGKCGPEAEQDEKNSHIRPKRQPWAGFLSRPPPKPRLTPRRGDPFRTRKATSGGTEERRRTEEQGTARRPLFLTFLLCSSVPLLFLQAWRDDGESGDSLRASAFPCKRKGRPLRGPPSLVHPAEPAQPRALATISSALLLGTSS